jgi:hypothetical protein
MVKRRKKDNALASIDLNMYISPLNTAHSLAPCLVLFHRFVLLAFDASVAEASSTLPWTAASSSIDQ